MIIRAFIICLIISTSQAYAASSFFTSVKEKIVGMLTREYESPVNPFRNVPKMCHMCRRVENACGRTLSEIVKRSKGRYGSNRYLQQLLRHPARLNPGYIYTDKEISFEPQNPELRAFEEELAAIGAEIVKIEAEVHNGVREPNGREVEALRRKEEELVDRISLLKTSAELGLGAVSGGLDVAQQIQLTDEEIDAIFGRLNITDEEAKAITKSVRGDDFFKDAERVESSKRKLLNLAKDSFKQFIRSVKTRNFGWFCQKFCTVRKIIPVHMSGEDWEIELKDQNGFSKCMQRYHQSPAVLKGAVDKARENIRSNIVSVNLFDHWQVEKAMDLANEVRNDSMQLWALQHYDVIFPRYKSDEHPFTEHISELLELREKVTSDARDLPPEERKDVPFIGLIHMKYLKSKQAVVDLLERKIVHNLVELQSINDLNNMSIWKALRADDDTFDVHDTSGDTTIIDEIKKDFGSSRIGRRFKQRKRLKMEARESRSRDRRSKRRERSERAREGRKRFGERFRRALTPRSRRSRDVSAR